MKGTLTELFEQIKRGEWDSVPDRDWADMPTFGGATPADTMEVWSWDETHLMVGTCKDDMRLVRRKDVTCRVCNDIDLAQMNDKICQSCQQGFVDGWTTCDECCEEITEEEFEDNNNHCGRCWSHKQEGEEQ